MLLLTYPSATSQNALDADAIGGRGRAAASRAYQVTTTLTDRRRCEDSPIFMLRE